MPYFSNVSDLKFRKFLGKLFSGESYHILTIRRIIGEHTQNISRQHLFVDFSKVLILNTNERLSQYFCYIVTRNKLILL